MPTTRLDFADLSATVRRAIEREAGHVLAVEGVSGGLNSELAVRLTTEFGAFHVKGLRSDHPRVWTQGREAAINPYLRGIAPRLCWRLEIENWELLGFEFVVGHHADYRPDSPDLSKVAELLRCLGEVQCPDIELREAPQRLEKYVARSSDVDHFAGTSLLHTDLNNDNVLVGEATHLVDWAWATCGAPWLDAGYWVIWLMAVGGHTPESAEKWAGEIPAWQSAPTQGVTAFAVANARLWEEIGGDAPDAWTSRLVRASRGWADWRTLRGRC
ncbi:phosphotransferase [Streptomyces sp. NBC_01235]|uniref:phosphotransferase n=1 Tax=Streptomyces sp. NBC_01235 TaxID=2903788 RepID=UPI002E16775F|nr:phosphotransferase [Streptomyces sp. NBC_01235]